VGLSPSDSEQESTDEQHSTEPDVLDRDMTRRGALRAGAAGAATVAALGTGVAPVAAQNSIDDLAFSSDVVDAPYITGTVTVETTEPDMAQLDHIDDSGEVTPLSDYGIVLAESTDEDSPHNPVTLRASDIQADEFSAFPRGITYDHDSDTSTDEVDVSALDADLWSTDVSSTAGSMSVSSPSEGRLKISTSSQTSGDVAIATFDLATAGSEDATITSGVDRKYLQMIADVDVLNTGATVEVRVEDSTGSQKVATIATGADETTSSVLLSSTGASQVANARLGELATDLSDIEKVRIAVLDANVDMTLDGLNLERESEWVFGSEEYLDSDNNVDTQDVTEPRGTYSITGLGTLPSALASAPIEGVKYDVWLSATEVPSEQVHAEVRSSPDSYDRSQVLDWVVEYEWPSAYDLSVSAGTLRNVTALPSSRYLVAEVATGIADIDPDADDSIETQVDNISWTDRSGSLGSVGDRNDLLTGLVSSDRTAVHIEALLSEDEVSTATDVGAGAGGAVAVGGSSGPLDRVWSIMAAVAGGIALYYRKTIASVLGGR
jgi:hypothetical protein